MIQQLRVCTNLLLCICNKILAKVTEGRKNYFLVRHEVQAGTWRQEVKQKSQRNTACHLLPGPYQLTFLKQLRSTSSGRPDPTPSINNMKKCTSLREEIPQSVFPLPMCPDLY